MRSISPLDMEALSVRTVASFRGVSEANEPGISRFRAQAKTHAPECRSEGQRPLFRLSVSPSYTAVARVRVNGSNMSAQRSIVIGGGGLAGVGLALAVAAGPCGELSLIR